MRTHVRLLVAALAAALAAPALVAQGPPPSVVETEPIVEREFRQELTLVGRTEARRESRIVAEIAGRVRKVAAEEGRRVSRGRALVEIDCRRIALALEAKQAQARQAKADAELTSKELERARELVATSIFPERDLDRAAAEEIRAAARYAELEAERRRLELDVEQCTVRAPFDGFTVRKLIDVGEWVEIGTPVYEMVDLSVVKVITDMPERHFGEVQIGRRARVTPTGEAAEPLTGEVTGIAPRAAATTHTFPVILEVDNGGGRLGSGMLVRVALPLAGTSRSLAVSKDALVRQGGRTVVYTVADGVASEVAVTPGATDGNLVAIAGDGLVAGLPVVVRGNERLAPGSSVRSASDQEGGG